MNKSQKKSSGGQAEVVYFENDTGYANQFKNFCHERDIKVNLISGDFSDVKSAISNCFYPVAVINISDLNDSREELKNLRSIANDTQFILISQENEHELIHDLLSAPNPVADAALGSKEEFVVRELFERCKEFIQDWKQVRASVKINFDQDIDEALTNFSISWSNVLRSSTKISIDRIKTELKIVISKLFSGSSDNEPIASEIDVETHRGSGKSSSYLFKLTPKLNLDSALNKSAVLKFGPKSEVKLESHNYDKYVEWFLTVQQTVRKIGYEETSNFSGLLYSFPLDADIGYDSFAEFVRRHTAEVSCEIIETIFSADNKHWLAIDGAGYKHDIPDDMQAYYLKHGLRTDKKMIKEKFSGMASELHAIGTKRSTTMLKEQGDTLSIPPLDLKIPNPIKWIMYPYANLINLSIVHGDLHANNILIDEQNKCYFIDFYYTGFGHIFRDFIDLELSVRYDLFCSKQIVNQNDRFTRLDSKDINDKGLRLLISLEKDIIRCHAKGEELDKRTSTYRNTHLMKGYDIITKIRDMAFANFPGKSDQYYLALAYYSIKAIKYFYPLDVRLYRLIISGLYFDFIGKPDGYE